MTPWGCGRRQPLDSRLLKCWCSIRGEPPDAQKRPVVPSLRSDSDKRASFTACCNAASAYTPCGGIERTVLAAISNSPGHDQVAGLLELTSKPLSKPPSVT